MSDLKSDGGPAFPPFHDPKNHESGMTLRDWFAGQALAGISADSQDGFSLSPEEEAAWAYQRADAMLAVRNQ